MTQPDGRDLRTLVVVESTTTAQGVQAAEFSTTPETFFVLMAVIMAIAIGIGQSGNTK